MRRGSISVFLSLLLTALLTLSLVLSESARYGALSYKVQSAGNSAIDSLFASYNRKLLEDYGLLFLDGGFGKGVIQEEELLELFLEFFDANASSGGLLTGGSFFQLGETEAVVTDIVSATDYSGEIFIRSVLDYAKYETAAELLSELSEQTEIVEQGESAAERADEEIAADMEREQAEAEKSAEGDDAQGSFDREKYEQALEESPIGTTKEVKRKGWINLVLPEGRTVSGYQIDTGDFPSQTAVDERDVEKGTLAERGSEKLMYNEYLLRHFSCFTDEEERTGVQYELEYILYGEDNDTDNLKKTLNRLLLIREGLNYQHILESSSKRQLAEAAATAIIGWTEMAPLVTIVATALMASWAFAEALVDVRDLLAGGKVPLEKTDADWNLDLNGVNGFLKGGGTERKDSGRGTDYRGYLRILLFMKDLENTAYRTMDMVQQRMRECDASFLMSSQIYALQIRTDSCAGTLFTRLAPLKQEGWAQRVGSYQIRDYFTELY